MSDKELPLHSVLSYQTSKTDTLRLFVQHLPPLPWGEGEAIDRNSNTSFPLTPTLSRGEREPSSPAAVLNRLLRIFGRENVFVEIQRHHLRGEDRWLRACAELAEQFHLPLLATNGVLYAKPWGRQVVDVFTCIRHHTHLDAAGKLLAQNSERHLKDAVTMAKLFRDYPQAITNT